MAHDQQLTYVSLASKYFYEKKRPNNAIEIGAYDLNGSVRSRISAQQHLGVDLIEGPGVDIVQSGHEVDLEDASFDCVISCECFEHNPYWKETFLNMHRLLSEDGIMLVTCASKGRLEHGTARTTNKSPGTQSLGWTYYRNLSASDFKKNFDLDSMFERYAFFYIPVSQDLYFYGIKSLTTFERSFGKIDFSEFESETYKIKKLSNSSNKLFHYANSIERAILSIARIFGETAFQDIAIPYYQLRNSLYKKIFRKE